MANFCDTAKKWDKATLGCVVILVSGYVDVKEDGAEKEKADEKKVDGPIDFRVD